MFKSISYLKNNNIVKITNSTKKIIKGSAFFAIKGSISNGNDYIENAIKLDKQISFLGLVINQIIRTVMAR